MRKWRVETFADPFHKQDRTIKSESKVLAAKRRKRDDTGKFNFEAKKEVIFIAPRTASLLDATFEKSAPIADYVAEHYIVSKVEDYDKTWSQDGPEQYPSLGSLQITTAPAVGVDESLNCESVHLHREEDHL